MANGMRRRAVRAAVSGRCGQTAAALLLLAGGALLLLRATPDGDAYRQAGSQRSASGIQREMGAMYEGRLRGGAEEEAVSAEEAAQAADAAAAAQGGDTDSPWDAQPAGDGGAAGPAAAPALSAAEEPPPTPSGTPAALTPSGTPAAPTPSGTPAPPTPSGTPALPTPSASTAAAAAAVAASDGAFAPARAVPPPTRGVNVTTDAMPSAPGRERAIVTLATGDESARMALALVQSLRDVGTDAAVDIVVLLFRGGVPPEACLEGSWQRAHGRAGVACAGPEAVAEEIIDERYVAALRRLGALVVVMEPLERYPSTKDIPGGTSSFWGMALNKLVVFKMTQYKKVIWMDGDTLWFRNMDHLWAAPTFTASITYACCNPNGPAIPSGGLWVLEPSRELWRLMDDQMRLGEPVYEGKTGKPVLDAQGQQTYQEWRLGDMAIVRQVFSTWSRNHHDDRLWPWIVDDRHGHVEGLRKLPMYKVLDDARFTETIWDSVARETWAEGFVDAKWTDRSRPVWHALDVMYDTCVSTCHCLPWRHTPYVRDPATGAESGYYSVHYTCMAGGTIEKPGKFTSDADFWRGVAAAHDCYKYYWVLWYEKFSRANGGGYPGEQYALPRPTYNATWIFNPPTVASWDRRRR